MSTTLDTAAKVRALYGGTWQAWGKGCVPVGVDSNDSDFNAPNMTGGSKTVALSTDQLPKNMGTLKDVLTWGNSSATATGMFSVSRCHNDRTAPEGGNFGGVDFTLGGMGQAHSNMPPYSTIYMWIRTA